jgi:hypothetical protein
VPLKEGLALSGIRSHSFSAQTIKVYASDRAATGNGTNIISMIKSRRIRWARKDDEKTRNVNNISVRKPETSTALGKRKREWSGKPNITACRPAFLSLFTLEEPLK